jgi:hypothetical protein
VDHSKSEPICLDFEWFAGHFILAIQNPDQIFYTSLDCFGMNKIFFDSFLFIKRSRLVIIRNGPDF